MEKVICDKREICKHRNECGGAKPHYSDENECGKCSMDLTAKCERIEE